MVADSKSESNSKYSSNSRLVCRVVIDLMGNLLSEAHNLAYLGDLGAQIPTGMRHASLQEYRAVSKLRSHTVETVSVRSLNLTSAEKQSVCGRYIFNVHIGASSV